MDILNNLTIREAYLIGILSGAFLFSILSAFVTLINLVDEYAHKLYKERINREP